MKTLFLKAGEGNTVEEFPVETLEATIAFLRHVKMMDVDDGDIEANYDDALRGVEALLGFLADGTGELNDQES